MTCAALDPSALLAWWTGELPARDAGALEEHLFACPACTRGAEAIAAIAEGTRTLVRAGRVHAALLPSLVERLAREGTRVRTFRARAGEETPCGVGAADELLVTRLEVPLAGLSRVDCEAVFEATGETARLEDVPFDPAADAVLVSERVAHARRLPAGRIRFALFGTGAGGHRRLGTWTLVHDPAGPPAEPA